MHSDHSPRVVGLRHAQVDCSFVVYDAKLMAAKADETEAEL